MISIGLTGGIASGKSQAGRYLAELGAHVLDADRTAHEAYAPGTPGFGALVTAFGREIVGADGVIDRAALGRVVFDNPVELARLTAIVWPLAREQVKTEMERQRAAGTAVFVVEAALLFDAEWQDLFDEVWLVRAPREAVLTRLQTRGLSQEEAERRLAAATNIEAAAARADRIIENAGSLEELREAIELAWTLVKGERN